MRHSRFPMFVAVSALAFAGVTLLASPPLSRAAVTKPGKSGNAIGKRGKALAAALKQAKARASFLATKKAKAAQKYSAKSDYKPGKVSKGNFVFEGDVKTRLGKGNPHAVSFLVTRPAQAKFGQVKMKFHDKTASVKATFDYNEDAGKVELGVVSKGLARTSFGVNPDATYQVAGNSYQSVEAAGKALAETPAFDAMPDEMHAAVLDAFAYLMAAPPISKSSSRGEGGRRFTNTVTSSTQTFFGDNEDADASEGSAVYIADVYYQAFHEKVGG